MRWRCSCCGRTMTTNSESSTPSISGCPATKDKKHKWVKA